MNRENDDVGVDGIDDLLAAIDDWDVKTEPLCMFAARKVIRTVTLGPSDTSVRTMDRLRGEMFRTYRPWPLCNLSGENALLSFDYDKFQGTIDIMFICEGCAGK